MSLYDSVKQADYERGRKGRASGDGGILFPTHVGWSASYCERLRVKMGRGAVITADMTGEELQLTARL